MRNSVMRTIAKLAASAVIACGAALASTAPAAAQVSFGVGIGAPVAPVYPAYPAYSSCYDGYGNYVYSYPYCTEYAAPVYPVYPAPVYAAPVIEPYFGIGIGSGWGGGWGYRNF